jgi:ubiquitin carboxyl-terminal hydrolase 5/13
LDPDFNDPLPEPAAWESSGGVEATTGASSGVDEGVVQSLVESLGCFTPDQVRAALDETGGAADRAADWLFSHMDDLDGAIAALKRGPKQDGNDSSKASGPLPSQPLDDGPGQYVLRGMISHIGKNTGSGHYVAHLKKDDEQWVIFNDEKVALSSNPPFPHAYLYLFQRKDTVGSPPSPKY